MSESEKRRKQNERKWKKAKTIKSENNKSKHENNCNECLSEVDLEVRLYPSGNTLKEFPPPHVIYH